MPCAAVGVALISFSAVTFLDSVWGNKNNNLGRMISMLYWYSFTFLTKASDVLTV